jgi:hypothetical protein
MKEEDKVIPSPFIKPFTKFYKALKIDKVRKLNKAKKLVYRLNIIPYEYNPYQNV